MTMPGAFFMPRQDQESQIEGFFRCLRNTRDAEEMTALREKIILANLGLVRALARKFSQRGELQEDLIQVGMVGLINAVDRFDPERGNRFATFAHPTILGEIRRYFRDKGWTVKVPRRLQELRLAVSRSVDRLSHELMRDPRISEIAADVGISEEQVIEIGEMDNLYTPASLEGEWEIEQPPEWEPRAQTAKRMDWQKILAAANLDEAVQSLSSRQRAVIQMRFFNGMTQTEVARTLNVSQMHVSRLQQQGLRALRRYFEGETIGKD